MKFKLAIALGIAFFIVTLLQRATDHPFDQKILYASLAAVIGLTLPYIVNTVYRFFSSSN